MPMNLDEWMDRSFKNWILVGAPLFLAIAIIVALPFHAARTSWDVVLMPPFCFALIQIVSFGAMYFARKYGRAHKNMRPAILVTGTYFLAMGLLFIHYSVGWSLMAQSEQHGNYVDYTICILCVTLILMTFRSPWKL